MNRAFESRLTPLEHFMFADDCKGNPIRFCFRVGFSGRLDSARWHRAFEAAKKEHVLLTAKVKRRPGQWIWTLEPKETEGTHEQETTSSSRWDFDLSREAGVRYLLEPRGDDCDLWLQVHHCCTDGRGTIAFLSSCFAHYEQQQAPIADQYVASSMLDTRQRDVARHRRLWSYLLPFGKRWIRIWAFYARRPTPLKSNDVKDPITDSSQRPTFLSRRLPFDNASWQARKRDLPVAATLNTILLSSMFQAISQWNKQLACDDRHQWIRIAVPMDLGTQDERDALAANYSSLIFLDRRSDQVHSFTELLSSVHQEMQLVKKHKLGFVFLDVLRILDRIPGGMRAVVNSGDGMTTTVLSNLGALHWLLPHDAELKVGKSIVREFDFVAPIRPAGATVAFGVVTYAGQLHITMNYDQQKISASDAAAFLDLLCRNIDDSLNGKAE